MLVESAMAADGANVFEWWKYWWWNFKIRWMIEEVVVSRWMM